MPKVINHSVSGLSTLDRQTVMMTICMDMSHDCTVLTPILPCPMFFNSVFCQRGEWSSLELCKLVATMAVQTLFLLIHLTLPSSFWMAILVNI